MRLSPFFGALTLAALAHARVVPRLPYPAQADTLTATPTVDSAALDEPTLAGTAHDAPAETASETATPPASSSASANEPDDALGAAPDVTPAAVAIDLPEALFSIHQAVGVVDDLEAVAACYDNYADADGQQLIQDQLDLTADHLKIVAGRLNSLVSAGPTALFHPSAVEECFGGRRHKGEDEVEGGQGGESESIEARATGSCTNAYYVITIGEAIYHIADDYLLVFSYMVENGATGPLYHDHFVPALVAYHRLLHSLRMGIPFLSREVAVLHHRLEDIHKFQMEHP